jgi:cysteinyl-tRNA synthetase
MALVSEVVRSQLPIVEKAHLLRGWDQVLGLDLDRAAPSVDLPTGAVALLDARKAARAAKNFQESDRLRGQLAAMGVAVIDTPDGQRWRVSAVPL